MNTLLKELFLFLCIVCSYAGNVFSQQETHWVEKKKYLTQQFPDYTGESLVETCNMLGVQSATHPDGTFIHGDPPDETRTYKHSVINGNCQIWIVIKDFKTGATLTQGVVRNEYIMSACVASKEPNLSSAAFFASSEKIASNLDGCGYYCPVGSTKVGGTWCQVLTCPVPPLLPLIDTDAILMEKYNGNPPPIINKLHPLMQDALKNFSSVIHQVGGTLTVTSAYRPQAYQAHFYEIYVRSVELNSKNNIANPACDAIRVNVNLEKSPQKHNLSGLVGKRDDSRHPKGLAFDATVTNLSDDQVNKIAAQFNLYRPYLNIPNNPEGKIHFQFVGN